MSKGGGKGSAQPRHAWQALLLLGCCLAPEIAWAQSSPGLYTGQVPSAAEWNSYFASKLDVAGGIATGKLQLVQPTGAGTASLNLPEGTAPSALQNGDVWTTPAGLFVRIEGQTIGPLGGISLPVTISQGGTGASDASDARSNLGAAASGANTDISSVSGFTDLAINSDNLTATVPSMSALSAMTAAQMAFAGAVSLAGYYTGSTLGGGTFNWLTAAEASGLTPDGGVVIAPSDHANTCSYGCLKKTLPGNVVSFYDFGAKNNVSGFDDSAAMNAAITSVADGNAKGLNPGCGVFWTSGWDVTPPGNSELQNPPEIVGCGKSNQGTVIEALATASGTFISATNMVNTKFENMRIDCESVSAITTCLDTSINAVSGPSSQNIFLNLQIQNPGSNGHAWDIANQNDSKFIGDSCVGIAGDDCIYGDNSTGDLEFYQLYSCPGMLEISAQTVSLFGPAVVCGFDIDTSNWNELNVYGGQIDADTSTKNVFNIPSGGSSYSINLFGTFVGSATENSFVFGGAGHLLQANLYSPFLDNSSGGTVTLVQSTLTTPNGSGAVVSVPEGFNAGVTMATTATGFYVVEGRVINAQGLYDVSPNNVTPASSGYLSNVLSCAAGTPTSSFQVQNGLVVHC